mgnify:CR=1 FL=1
MVRHTLRERVRLVTLPTGDRALVIDTEPPDDAPEPIREGFARRALVNGGDRCPCGAGMTRDDLTSAIAAGGIGCLSVAHCGDCPADDDALRAALDAWMGGGE